MAAQRAHWNSRLGFILAAAGSAVGLGNIWRFPYVTGENGGGWFVLIYIGCILLVGLPVMMGEILMGRITQKSPVGAFRDLSRKGSPWVLVGWSGIAAAFLMLSFYSIVAGWTLHYLVLSGTGVFEGIDRTEATNIFIQDVAPSASLNLGWHLVFMAITVFIVIGGVQRGIELGTKIMMPVLLLMMVALLILAIVTDFESGFRPALEFAFSFRLDNPPQVSSVLEALGQAFFTLSLGMGAMITYGSYLDKDDDVVSTSWIVAGLDTLIALLACMVVFPFVFHYGLDPDAGPGLVFQLIPLALSKLPFGQLWTIVFFGLLFFAALTSAISMLEVVVSHFVDEWKWPRWMSTIVAGSAIAIMGIPSALSGGPGIFGMQFQDMNKGLFKLLGNPDGLNWMDTVNYVVSNVMLPLGGLMIALFVSWGVSGKIRKAEYERGTRFRIGYYPWLFILRFIVPIAVIIVFLNAIGVLEMIREVVGI